ncbi:MAG: hypothetical protein ABJA67_18650, partial [Chthonomonadales bacterium]
TRIPLGITLATSREIGGNVLKSGMNWEQSSYTQTPSEQLQYFLGALGRNATNPENYKQYAQGELEKLSGIGEGLTNAKNATKAAASAGLQALGDGTVIEFLAKPNAINDPLFKTATFVLDAMGKDSNVTNKVLSAFGTALERSSEQYSKLPNHEKGRVIGEAMFGLVNPEGSTEAAEAGLKIADVIATHVDKAVVQTVQQSIKSIDEIARTPPEIAQQSKQMLCDYLKQKGLTGPELEYAGVPRGYFDSVKLTEKSDNVLAMSKAGDAAEEAPKSSRAGYRDGEITSQIDKATGRLQRTDLGKVRESYNWEALNEQFSNNVIRQSTEDSCISAVGEMLSDGRLTESALMAELGDRPDVTELLKYLGSEWTSEAKRFKSFAEIGQKGPWAAELMENSGTELEKSLHTVVVDGVESSGNLIIRDPWEGTTYEMTQQSFLKDWTRRSVYRF